MGTIILRYNLWNLPSSQHRCGLVGLVEVLRWMKMNDERKGTAKLLKVSAQDVEVELDQEGIEDIFNQIYAASTEERRLPKPYKDKNGNEKPWLRKEEEETIDPKTQKKSMKTSYIYTEIVPLGAFLLDRDPSRNGESGVWIKLWRDMVWNILRGVPATRKPFENRAKKLGPQDTKTVPEDAKKIWHAINSQHQSIELPSTYYLGAQSKTAENTGFRDQASNLFLLHFWPFVTQVYQPQVVDNEGTRKNVGFAIVIPDISNIKIYADEIKNLLLDRNTDLAGYRPKQAIVDIPLESALDFMNHLHEGLQQRVGKHISDVVFGFDVIHAEKEGNNVRIRSVHRMQTNVHLLTSYLPTKDLWSYTFRTHWLWNIILSKHRWSGFDKVCTQKPIDTTFNDYKFRHDARHMLRGDSTMDNRSDSVNLEQMVFDIARKYVAKKVAMKEGVSWKSEETAEVKKYKEKTEDTARKAFLAVRSRSGIDFIEFFTGTLCSVPQFLPLERYEKLSKTLIEDPERVRTLTLVALSAAAYVSDSSPKTKTTNNS